MRGSILVHVLTWGLLPALAGGCGGGAAEEAGPSLEERCEEVVAAMAECYPDLAAEAECTEETVAQFDRLGAGAGDCDEVEKRGKADFFSFGGCGRGQHVCGWFFCCDDYTITWFPDSEDDWDIVSLVADFQAEAPSDAMAQLDDRDALRRGTSVTFLQQVAEYPQDKPQEMAVHVTRILVDVPYEDFDRVLPAEDWGIRLDHYLGGEVKVYERDSQGRAVRQLERMVLSPFPCDWESVLSNNDMTKVEVIHYWPEGATVYWRVMYSNNNSTETDVGSVDFRRWDDGSTLVTFHSAHRLNAPGGIHIPNSLLKLALSGTFLDFARHYQWLVEAETGW